MIEKELLQKIIDWYYKDSSVGGLSVLMDEIEEEYLKSSQNLVGTFTVTDGKSQNERIYHETGLADGDYTLCAKKVN